MRQILERNGIVSDDAALATKPSVLNCPRCAIVNAAENKFCSKCSYPLTVEAYSEAKRKEEQETKAKVEQLLQRQDRFEEILQAMIDGWQLRPIAEAQAA